MPGAFDWLTAPVTSLDAKSADDRAGTPTRGERTFAEWVGPNYSSFSTPGGWSGDKLAAIEAYRGWVAKCVGFLSGRVGVVPSVVRAAGKGESEEYAAGIKAYRDGRRSAPPPPRSFVSAVRKKSLAGYRYGTKGSTGVIRPHSDLEHVADDHPLVRLLNDPNRPEVAADFWPYFVLFRYLTAVSYLWKVRDKDNAREDWGAGERLNPDSPRGRDRGNIVELWVLPSPWVTPRSDERNLISHYEIRPFGTRGAVERLHPDDVIQWGEKSPAHPLAFCGPTQAGASIIDVYGMIEVIRYNALNNGADPGGVFVLPEGTDDLSPQSLQRLASRFQGRFGGPYNAGVPLILPPGSSYTPRSGDVEAAYRESLDQARDYVMAMYDLDKSLMGFLETATYAGPVVARNRLKFDVIRPMHLRLAQTLTEQLAAEFGDDLAVVFDDDDTGLIDPEQRRQDIDQLMRHPDGSAITINELRVEHGLEKVDDPEADKLHFNPSVVSSDHLDDARQGQFGGMLGEGGESGAGGNDDHDDIELDGGGDDSDPTPGVARPLAESTDYSLSLGKAWGGRLGGFDTGEHAAEFAVATDSLIALNGKKTSPTVRTPDHRPGTGKPPWPGAVYDEIKHRWVSGRRDEGHETHRGRFADATKPLAAAVAEKLGVSESEAHDYLQGLAGRLATRIDEAGATGGSIRVGETGYKLTMRRKPAQAGGPAGETVPEKPVAPNTSEASGHGKPEGTGEGTGGAAGRSGGVREPSPGDGRQVAGAAGEPGGSIADQGRDAGRQPAGDGTLGSVPGGGGEKPAAGESTDRPADVAAPPARVPADIGTVNGRLDRYEKFFREKGEHQVADWVGKLRAHVNEVGTEEALKSLGAEAAGAGHPSTQYEGGWETMGHFAEAYLDRHGITPVHTIGYEVDTSSPLVSSASPKYGGSGEHGAPGSFLPRDPTLANKLEEAKHLPGLESSEDLDTIVGRPVTHLTPGTVEALDHKYGPGKWIVKAYGDDAAAGYGIYFPQRAAQVTQDAKNTLWAAGEHLAKHGFELDRDGTGRVVGLKHTSGDRYPFGTPEYNRTINGDVRHWGDAAALAAPHEKAAALPNARDTIAQAAVEMGKHGFHPLRDKSGTVVGIEHANGDRYKFGSSRYDSTIDGDVRRWADAAAGAAAKERHEPKLEFMGQPAFPVVGISDADRAAGMTIKPGQEGRVHVVTRDGKAEVVPHSTWLKEEHLPVVFETDDTRAMAEAARKAIEALPHTERRGQIYAPDIVKTADGYKVVEANPANHTGSSGYLGNSPFIIDAYVSHLTGREPGHVAFIRNLLTTRGRNGEKAAGGVEGKSAAGESHPGPPPRPGLVFDRGSHRWVRPDLPHSGHDDHPTARAVPIRPQTDDEIEDVRRFRDQAHAVIEEWVGNGAAHLPESQREHYAATLKKCFDNMPTPIAQRVIKATGDVRFYKDTAAVTDEIRSRGRRVAEGRRVGGFWSSSPMEHVGELHIDGGADTDSGFASLDSREIYAHELGHALDLHGRYSRQGDWHKAWAAEIDKGHAPLSEYARTDPAEGFAEYHRLMNTMPGVARKEYPACWAFMKSQGLV